MKWAWMKIQALFYKKHLLPHGKEVKKKQWKRISITNIF